MSPIWQDPATRSRRRLHLQFRHVPPITTLIPSIAMGNYRFVHPQKKLVYITQSIRGVKPRLLSDSSGYSLPALRRLKALYRDTGKVIREDMPRGAYRMLSTTEIDFLEGLILRTPDMYLRELQDALISEFDVQPALCTISLALKRRGYTRKQVSRIAIERSEELRLVYQGRIGDRYRANQLVFLDESASNRFTMQRRFAWSPAGSRARRRDFFIRGVRYSILPAISLGGVLHLDIITRAWNSSEFRRFIEALLDRMQPYPAPNSVLVMDNASLHHFEGIREMVEARGCCLEYLPPYSPDYNPIEEGFSSTKYWIRANREEALEADGGQDGEPIIFLWRAVYACMTPENIEGWFANSNYLPRRLA